MASRSGEPPTDPLRLGVLERDRTLPLRELFDRIDAGIARWERRVAGLSANEAAAIGRHPRLGEMTADQLARSIRGRRTSRTTSPSSRRSSPLTAASEG